MFGKLSCLLLLAAGCGIHAAEPRPKYVGHVVFVTTEPPPNQASLKKVGDAFHSHLQLCVSPKVQILYKGDEIDLSVGADDRDELRLVMDELISRGKRPLHISFQLIATDKDYARIMGKEADPRIANSYDIGPGAEAPLVEGDDRKIVKDGQVVAEWTPVGRGMAYNYMAMAHRMSEVGGKLQVLVLNSPNDLTDEDIIKFWDQNNEIIVKFSPDGAQKLRTLTTDRQHRQMGIVVDGRVDDISAPGAVIENGIIGFHSKIRTPATKRLATYLKMVTNPSPFHFVRSYVEGE